MSSKGPGFVVGLSREEADSLKHNIKAHEGYKGLFTREQADGAIENGTQIVKVNSLPGDKHENGELGHVLGSIPVPPHIDTDVKHLYFVEWDSDPKVAIGVIDRKVERTN